MTITSDVFINGGTIPPRYTCDGENINPPLTLSGIPDQAKSLVVMIEDRDAPSKPNFTHWLLYNIPPSTLQILKDSIPAGSAVGMNGFGSIGYGGPCPPSGTHRYVFKLFALDALLPFESGITKDEVIQAMHSHIIDTAEVVGLYSKST